MDKMFKHNIPLKNNSLHICWQSVSFVCSDTTWMKKSTSSLQSCSNSRGAGCLLSVRSIGTHCCFWFVLHGVFAPVCRSLLKENRLFHKPQASEVPYHEPSTSKGRCSASFCKLHSQDRITYLSGLWGLLSQASCL